MTPEAKRLLQQAVATACESMPGADEVAITSKAAAYLASLCAQLEALLGFDAEGTGTMH